MIIFNSKLLVYQRVELISPLVQGIVTLENLGDISAGHQGSVVEVDKDGDIKVHPWQGGVHDSNVGNVGFGDGLWHP